VEEMWRDEYIKRATVEESWKNLKRYHVHPTERSIDRLDFSRNRSIIVGSFPNYIVCVDPSNRTVNRIFSIPRTNAIEFKQDCIAVGTLDGTVHFSKLGKNGSFSSMYEFNQIQPRAILKIFFLDHSLFLTLSEDGLLYAWNYSKKLLACIYNNRVLSISCVQICGEQICVGSELGIEIWDASGISSWEENMAKKDSLSFIAFKNPVRQIFYNPKTSYSIVVIDKVYSKNNYTPIELWDLREKRCIFSLQSVHHALISCVGYLRYPSSNNGLFISGDESGAICIWKETNENIMPIKYLDLHDSAVQQILFSPTVILSVAKDGGFSILDYMSYSRITYSKTLASQNSVSHACISDDCISIAIGMTLYMWVQRSSNLHKPKAAKTKIKVPLKTVRHLGHNKDEILEEARDAIRESHRQRQKLIQEKRLIHSINGDPRVHGMCDEDLVTHAMLKSMETSGHTFSVDDTEEREMLELAKALSLSETNK
jgi:WD40 repeat protein